MFKLYEKIYRDGKEILIRQMETIVDLYEIGNTEYKDKDWVLTKDEVRINNKKSDIFYFMILYAQMII